MNSASYYKGLVSEMVTEDKDRDEMYRKIDNMVHLVYNLPDGVEKIPGIHKVTNTAPFDAVRSATNVLSAVSPKAQFTPYRDDAINKERAGQIETMLSWWFRGLNRRKNATVQRDIIRSALLYDEVCFQTVYLPHQAKALKAIKGKSLMQRQRFGPFAWNVHNPQHVHSLHGDYGLESVALVKTMHAYKALSFWGDAAKGLQAKLMENVDDDGNTVFEYVTLFDYMDSTHRYVYAIPSEVQGGDLNPKDACDILELQEHGLDFMPWVSVVGGSNLEMQGQHRRIPLLYPVVQTKQWKTASILETLATTQAIRHVGKPRVEITGPTTDEGVYYEHDNFETVRRIMSGYSAKDIPPNQLDEAIMHLADRTTRNMNQSTTSAVLQGNAPSGAAFATMNLMLQTGLTMISPYKRLAENAFAEGFVQMLLWIKEGGEAVTARGTGEQAGLYFTIEPDEIDPLAIDLVVKLTEETPTDKISKINAAGIAVNQLGMSRETAMSEVGIADPIAEAKRAMMERVRDTMIEIELGKMQAQAQMEIQAAQMEIQAQQQAAMQAQQQPEQPLPPTGNPGGVGFDPNQGGQSYAELNPGATYEGQTGLTRDGQVVV